MARQDRMWATLRSMGGVTLIGLGLLATVVPIIPGIPLIIAGAALAGPKHPLVRAARERLKRWRSRSTEREEKDLEPEHSPPGLSRPHDRRKSKRLGG